MITQLEPISALLEINERPNAKASRPLSTLAFDWLYVALALLLTIGIMMDVWSHIEFGPDQSIFNEYHLLFYGSVSAIVILLMGLAFSNMRNGQPLRFALPQGYGFGLLAALLFGVSGVIDLTGHALFGFESQLEALTSPLHLLLFATWFLIMFAPVNAARARQRAQRKHATLLQSLPMLIAFGGMLVTVSIPLMNYFPMGTNPWMIQDMRPEDDYYGLVMGISGILLQTAITVPFALWLAREFRMPRGAFTIAFGFYGLFWTIIQAGNMPWLLFGGFGILLDVAYIMLKPDATRRLQFILFAMFAAAAMWAMTYGTLAFILGGFGDFYYSGYNLYGSIAQAIALSALVGYLMSMSTPRQVAVGNMEVANA